MDKELLDTSAERVERARELFKSFNQKAELHDKKWLLARKQENRDRHYDLFRMYRALSRRADDLLSTSRSGPDHYAKQLIQWAYQSRLEYKQRRQEEFLSKYRYSMWFLSGSFGADYGTFHCDHCGRKFYHSPSTIKRGIETLFECCCGYCTNSIVEASTGKTPYK